MTGGWDVYRSSIWGYVWRTRAWGRLLQALAIAVVFVLFVAALLTVLVALCGVLYAIQRRPVPVICGGLVIGAVYFAVVLWRQAKELRRAEETRVEGKG